LVHYSFLVEDGENGLRLDSYIALQEEVEQSRSYISTIISNGRVTIDGIAAAKPSTRVRAGQEIRMEVPDAEPVDLLPEDIELDVVFEDEHLIVINKQPGLVIHPSGTCRSGTLVNALMARCTNLSGISGELRPGIVHRLDRDTTGLMMAAKDDVTHRGLSEQLSARSVNRRYIALLWHVPEPGKGRIDAPIGRDLTHRKKMTITATGKRAVTNYRVLRRYRFACLVECRLETGRTHQIRVHLAGERGCPVIGDEKYGGTNPRGIPSTTRNRELVQDVLRAAGHQMLHAETLGFRHPVTGEPMEFNQAPPLEFLLARNRLERDMDE